MRLLRQRWLNILLSATIIITFFSYLMAVGDRWYAYSVFIACALFGFAVCIRKPNTGEYKFFDSFNAAVLELLLAISICMEIWYILEDKTAFLAGVLQILAYYLCVIMVLSVIAAGICIRFYYFIIHVQKYTFQGSLTDMRNSKIAIAAMGIISAAMFFVLSRSF